MSAHHDKTPRLILASASPSRRQILEEAGLDFEVVVSEVDEPAVVASAVEALGPLTPAEEALLLARTKAEDVASRGAARGALVLGCDSVFELDGVAYGKPYEVEVAVQRWRQMRGATGILHTGHWLVDASSATRTTGSSWLGQKPGHDGELKAAGETVSTRITFGRPTDEQIRDYAESGEPLHCAGAFTLEGAAAKFIEHVDGDRESVIGVSPAALARLRAQLAPEAPPVSSGRG
ncbi:nucleoside triphosphate pyrophosphatase [Nesterenkonia sp. CL21]|uniref:Maf family protein n=1 Tax=Nesterenkonia sp. CL21 TaxID=3064894 RepID=UPI0028786FFA|nr:nucleoside triphosphate pyrophosphatase [Nesterenkonia sp. CL21]MDS2172052.1 nucleoside triphosphate pyrophosphatase [Nesterenkonia sp. CL21]